MRRVIRLQTPTVLWLGGGIISLSYLNTYEVNDVRQTDIWTAEPLVLEFSVPEVQMATEKLKRHITRY